MRAKLTSDSFRNFTNTIRRRLGVPLQHIARRICKVTPRTFSDWRRGRYTVPLRIINVLARVSGVSPPPIERRLADFWYTHSGGSAGGLAVVKKYGAIGTPEGRRRGALRALRTHRRLKTGFFIAKKIRRPPYSGDLAEFIGILLGDGGITPGQVIVTLNRETDAEYLVYIRKLCGSLFHVTPSIILRRDTKACNLVLSRRRLVHFLIQRGLEVGSKVRRQARVPSWIVHNNEYALRCLRGLFDTDGCCYIDRHRYKNRVYSHCGLNFTNRSLPLLAFFKLTLQALGFNPTQRTKYSVFLRRKDEIVRFFAIVRPSNQKHVRRFRDYLSFRYGGVPKWS